MSRKLFTYGNYFLEFYEKLDKKVQEKIDWVFELIQMVNIIPSKYFKHLENTDGLFEIRVEYESNIYRICCFFDEGNLIILINSFQKKTQKTPNAELELASKLKKQYFLEKKSTSVNEKSNNKKDKR